MDYHQKYLKYKAKYLDLKENMYGGTLHAHILNDFNYNDITDTKKITQLSANNYDINIHNALKKYLSIKQIMEIVINSTTAKLTNHMYGLDFIIEALENVKSQQPDFSKLQVPYLEKLDNKYIIKESIEYLSTGIHALKVDRGEKRFIKKEIENLTTEQQEKFLEIIKKETINTFAGVFIIINYNYYRSFEIINAIRNNKFKDEEIIEYLNNKLLTKFQEAINTLTTDVQINYINTIISNVNKILAAINKEYTKINNEKTKDKLNILYNEIEVLTEKITNKDDIEYKNSQKRYSKYKEISKIYTPLIELILIHSLGYIDDNIRNIVYNQPKIRQLNNISYYLNEDKYNQFHEIDGLKLQTRIKQRKDDIGYTIMPTVKNIIDVHISILKPDIPIPIATKTSIP